MTGDFRAAQALVEAVVHKVINAVTHVCLLEGAIRGTAAHAINFFFGHLACACASKYSFVHWGFLLAE
jgi:hypothetical protein